eukprot:scaffold6285_cov121-Isochrysis_galbana.AAC.15
MVVGQRSCCADASTLVARPGSQQNDTIAVSVNGRSLLALWRGVLATFAQLRNWARHPLAHMHSRPVPKCHSSPMGTWWPCGRPLCGLGDCTGREFHASVQRPGGLQLLQHAASSLFASFRVAHLHLLTRPGAVGALLALVLLRCLGGLPVRERTIVHGFCHCAITIAVSTWLRDAA